jgi:hypothetical protein
MAEKTAGGALAKRHTVSKHDQFFVLMGWFYPLARTPLTIFVASLVQKYNEIVLIVIGVTKCNFLICMADILIGIGLL